jgi:hypothetical protein
MKHFLARLVDRARGNAPRVEPIVASRFAPAARENLATTEFSERQGTSAAAVSGVASKLSGVKELSEQNRTASTVATQGPEKSQASFKLPETLGQPSTPLFKPKPQSQPPFAPEQELPPASEQTIDAPSDVIHESLLLPQQEETSPLVLKQTHTSRTTDPVVTGEKRVARTLLEQKHEAPSLISRQTQRLSSRTRMVTPAPDEQGVANTPAGRKHEAQPKAEEPREEHAEPVPLGEPTPSLGQLLSLRKKPRPQPIKSPPQRIKPTWLATNQAHTPVATPRFSLLPEREREEAPIVHVTIGRIEVRAAPTAVTRARKPPRRPAPAMTLDAYLKSRKEGVR